jgi:hypothetical protein
MERFQSGRTSIINEDHSGHPTTSEMADNAEQVNTGSIQPITVTDKLDISCGSAYSNIREDFWYHKI